MAPSAYTTADTSGSTTRAVLLGAGALLVAAATSRGRGRRLDDRLFGLANGRLHHPFLDRAFRAITELGSLWASLAAGAALSASGRRRAATDGVGAATAERDGPFGDYSQAPEDMKPSRDHVIDPG